MKKSATVSLLLTLLLMVCVNIKAQDSDFFSVESSGYQDLDVGLPAYNERTIGQPGAAINIGMPESGYGSLYLESDPPGANVFIEDILQGVTPLLITDVLDGVYSIRFEKEGYLNHYNTVEVAAKLTAKVTANMMPREKTWFMPDELYTTLIYEYSAINNNNWAVGNSWGVFFKNFNLEQTITVHIGMRNSIGFEGAFGYGFIIADRFRLTPQIAYSGININDIRNDKDYWIGYLRGALNLKAAITEQYALYGSIIYDKSGPGFRIGALFYVN